MVAKHKGELPLFGNVGKDASAAKSLCIKHFDDPSVCISAKEDILLLIQAADPLVKND